MVIHRHRWKAYGVAPWKPYGYIVRGYMTMEQCECGKTRERIHGNKNENTDWPMNTVPTVKKFNEAIKQQPKDIHMGKLAIGCLAATGIVGFILFAFIGGALAFRNEAIRAEAGVTAQYTQNQNSYDVMWKKMRETAQVPAMYTDDMKKVWESAITGRYGADGSKAMFQWITEHNPEVDSSLYRQIQIVIEASRNQFAADQTSLIDKKREYEVLLKSNRGLFYNWLPFMAFPHIDLSKYDIVTSDDTTKAFETKKADEIKLR